MALPNFDDIDRLMTDVRRERGLDEEEPPELAMPNVDPVVGESGPGGGMAVAPTAYAPQNKVDSVAQKPLAPPAAPSAPAEEKPPAAPLPPPIPTRDNPHALQSGESVETHGSKRVKEDEETKKAEAAAVIARANLVKKTAATNEALKDVKETEAQQAEAELFQEQKMLEEREAAAKQHAERLAELRAERDERRAAMEKSANITSYWEDKSVPARLLGMLLTGASELSWSRNGGQGPSPFFQFLQREEMRDNQRKQRIHDVDRMRFEAAKGALKEGEEQRKIEMKDLDDTQAARRAVMLKEMGAIIKRSGVPAAQANYDRLTAEVASDQAAKDEESARKDDAEATYSKSTKTGGDAGGDKKPEATSGDINTKSTIDEEKKINDEIRQIVSTPEGAAALKSYQEARRKVGGIDAMGNMTLVGPLFKGAMSAAGVAQTIDEKLADNPTALRLNELIQNKIAAKARARGGPITKEDDAAVSTELNLRGASPKDMAKSLEAQNENLERRRAALTAGKNFRDEPSGPQGGLSAEEVALLTELRRRRGGR